MQISWTTLTCFKKLERSLIFDKSNALEEKGYSVDRRDIHVDAIKVLGQHQARVKLGEGLEANLTIVVERKEG